MASSAPSEPLSNAQQTNASQERSPPSNAVEMSNLHAQSQGDGTATGSPETTGETAASSNTPAASSEPTHTSSNMNTEPTKEASTSSAAPPTQQAAGNTEDAEAIAPSATNASKQESAAGPVVNITLLLTSGARHPYKIDQKYLRKRSVEVEANDPFNISVYTLKELIWRDWRSEWEPRPSNPTYIRLISFGRMLEDKLPLKECRFNHDAPNIVHMTVKPQEIADEDDTKTGKSGRGADGEDRGTGCRCVIL